MTHDHITRRSFLAATALGAGTLAASSAPATLARAAAAAAQAAGARAPTSAQWAALRRSLAGALVLPSDVTYRQAKLVYDLRFEGARPAAVAYPRTTTDVQRLVDFARSHGLAPIPRCGGHSYAGYSTGSGLVIDVANLGGVIVSGSQATVGAGTRLIDMYSALAARGVLVPGGSCPTVGISGLTLGGGIGVLGRKYGLTADALRELTVVTADGRALTRRSRCDTPTSTGPAAAAAGATSGSRPRFASPCGRCRRWRCSRSTSRGRRPGTCSRAWMEWVRRAPDELWSNCLLLSAGSSGLIARTTGVYVGSTSALATLLAQLRGAVGAAPTSSSLTSATYLQAMLIEAGCADISLAQCHIQAPGSAGTLPRTAFLAKSAYFAKAPPSAGIASVVGAVDRLPARAALAGRRPRIRQLRRRDQRRRAGRHRVRPPRRALPAADERLARPGHPAGHRRRRSGVAEQLGREPEALHQRSGLPELHRPDARELAAGLLRLEPAAAADDQGDAMTPTTCSAFAQSIPLPARALTPPGRKPAPGPEPVLSSRLRAGRTRSADRAPSPPEAFAPISSYR